MNRAEIENAIGRFLGSGAHPGVVSAYLFGSVAEERSHRESDVDIGVLLSREAHPTARQRFDQRLGLSSALGSPAGGRSADIVILNDAPPHLARRIVTEGRRVFCSDSELDHAFVRDVQLRAADLEPFMRRMQRIKLEAMKGRDVPRRTTG
jgi:predicted nucleotidyltransferase